MMARLLKEGRLKPAPTIARGFALAAFAGVLLALAGIAAGRQGARVVVDETGRHVNVPAEVRRIVSLAPNLTETIYALGDGTRLAGDTDECDVPEEAKSKPHVGEPVDPSLEAIVGLKPDIVLASASINWPQTADALLKMGVPVYTTDAHTVDGMLGGIEKIGGVIGSEAAADALVSGLRAKLDALRTKLAGSTPRRVLFVVWDQPLISIGRHTFVADALRLAGGTSVIDVDENWPRIGVEEVVRLQPDFLVFVRDHGDTSASTIAELRQRPVWRDLAAVKSGNVAFVSNEVERPAPKLIDAIEDLAKQLHPEAFAKADAGGAR
jgi:iron complex transport system substrate-binding protein